MMRRYVVGTAGHVDHGKTTLVRALTGVETDRLPEEKRRGISIELGFAPWDLGDGVHASVIDVPGHKRLVHAMISGATGIELVILVVAADEGVMPQTREHVAVCDLLGVRSAVIAVTKADLVDDDLARLAAAEARGLLGDDWRAEVVVCSATTGRGIDDVTAAVRRALRARSAPLAVNGVAARLAVDRVFSVRGAGTVVTGTLASGTITRDQALTIAGRAGCTRAIARSLQIHDAGVEEASAPTRLAINLGGVGGDEVNRGDVVTDAPHAESTTRLDVHLVRQGELSRGASFMIHLGAARTAARIDAISGQAMRLRLAEPLVVFGGDRFILRGQREGQRSGLVAGGGLVLDARPPARSRCAGRAALFAALASEDANAAVFALVAEASPRPLTRASLSGRFVLGEDALVSAAERLVKERALVRLESGAFIARGSLVALATRARDLVVEHHREAPHDRGMPVQTVREKLAAVAGMDAAEAALAETRGKGQSALVFEADVVRTEGHGRAIDPARARAVDAASRAIRDAGPRGATEFAIRQAVGEAEPVARAILAKLSREKVVVAAGDLWFSADVVEAMRERVVVHLSDRKRMTILEWKQLSGLARKQAVLLLEHFDRAGVTRRDGDARVLA